MAIYFNFVIDPQSRFRRSCTRGLVATKPMCPSKVEGGALAVFTSQGEDASVHRTRVRREVEPHG